jgi:hypothetical protein
MLRKQLYFFAFFQAFVFSSVIEPNVALAETGERRDS